MKTDSIFYESLRKGDFKKSVFYIRRLYDKTENKLYGAFLITATIVEAVKEMNAAEKKFYVDKDSIEDSLCKEFSIDKAEEILGNICRYVRSERKAEKKDIFKKAVSYINANYALPILSANLVAAEMNEPVSMIAKLFRDYSGMGVWEYVTSVRMKEALYLLENSRYKVRDIAVQVGYTTDETFIRTFKRIYGITPGKYRDRYTG